MYKWQRIKALQCRRGRGSPEIASVLDGQLGPFGELGLDLAIDEGGAIWFIEANTKPDKDLVVGLDKIDGIHSQYLSIFEYAGYLCGLKG